MYVWQTCKDAHLILTQLKVAYLTFVSTPVSPPTYLVENMDVHVKYSLQRHSAVEMFKSCILEKSLMLMHVSLQIGQDIFVFAQQISGTSTEKSHMNNYKKITND